MITLLLLTFVSCENPGDLFYDVTPGAKKKYKERTDNCRRNVLFLYTGMLYELETQARLICNNPNSTQRKNQPDLEKCIQTYIDNLVLGFAGSLVLCPQGI